MFIGSAERRLEKPECISPATARQCARAARSFGIRPGLRHDFVEIVGDRQSIPDLDAVVGQAGHQKRRRQQEEFGAHRGIVRGHDLLGEIEPGELAQEPPAQRPRSVILAGNGERCLGHASYFPPILRPDLLSPLSRRWTQRGRTVRGPAAARLLEFGLPQSSAPEKRAHGMAVVIFLAAHRRIAHIRARVGTYRRGRSSDPV